MQLIKMSYKGFTFGVNPSTLKRIQSKNVKVNGGVFSFCRVNEISQNPETISGRGYFTGEDAYLCAEKLSRVFRRKGSSYLFIPGFAPIKAHFTSFAVTASADKNRIEYSFEFTEDISGKKTDCDFGYTFAKNGENMFDIANRTSRNIENLMAVNDFADAFSVREGDRVILC